MANKATSLEFQNLSRFDLSSTEAGLVASCYDIVSCVCVLFVTYLGGHGHKPQWIGWGAVVMASGILLFSLPHFLSADDDTLQSALSGANSSATSSECIYSDARKFRCLTVCFRKSGVSGVGSRLPRT